MIDPRDVMARDFDEVIDRIIAEVPEDATYRAPELRHFDWAALQEELADYDAQLAVRPEWLDKAGRILAGLA